MNPRARRVVSCAALIVSIAIASCAGERGVPERGASSENSHASVVNDSTLSLRPATVSDVLAMVRAPGPRATVVNIWATWCGPCREEFPELMQLHAVYRDSGLRLLLVSADFADQKDEAMRFLASQGVDFGTYLKQGDDMEFINTLNPHWTGALPATLVYDGEGRLQYFHEGRFSRPDLEAAVVTVLHPQEHSPGG